jgi:glycosyltransferase involved in cell wall biosynthesis
MAAYHRLAKDHDVELLTNVQGIRVRHMPWADVLAAKARADILFDQVQLGYGNNAIEAWCMGLPVIAGVADWKVRDAMVARFGKLPFYEATEDTIGDALRRVVESADMRAEYAALGMAHVRKWHDAREVVRMLSEVYEAAPRTNANVTQQVTTPRNWAARRASMRARQQALRARRVA